MGGNVAWFLAALTAVNIDANSPAQWRKNILNCFDMVRCLLVVAYASKYGSKWASVLSGICWGFVAVGFR